MHPAWQIEDIRYLIFRLLEPQDLARLAQTCKGLFHVATDELWRTLTSISPFLRCLPKSYIHQALQASDLERLHFYAPKVHRIVLESSEPIRLPRQFWPINKATSKEPEDPSKKSWHELWSEVAKLRSEETDFLPNLRTLRVNDTTEALLIPLIGISGSNLTQIYLRYMHQYRESPGTIPKLLGSLNDTNKLEYLFVRDGEPDLVPSGLIAKSPLKHLRLDPRISGPRGWWDEVCCKKFPLRPVILQKSTLEHLTLGLTREWHTADVRSSQGKYLPALKTLWLNLTTFKPEQCCSSCINAHAHSWTCLGEHSILPYARSCGGIDCGRRSPTLFLERLDNPELKLLNIKLPVETTGRMLLEVVSAAKNSCRLRNLTELALAGGGWFHHEGEFPPKLPPPKIAPRELREALILLLPMPHLKVLRLSVAPNFLDVLDLELYETITSSLPSLETLLLGHSEFTTSDRLNTTYYERVPLNHLAAFCRLLPNLVEVSVGCVDGMILEQSPRVEWACPGVQSLRVVHWAGNQSDRGVPRELLQRNLRAYFPYSDLAGKELDPRRSCFEP